MQKKIMVPIHPDEIVCPQCGTYRLHYIEKEQVWECKYCARPFTWAGIWMKVRRAAQKEIK